MAAGTFLGAVALFATGLLARSVASDDLHDLAATLRAVAIGFLPAIGLHLALGLPEGRLGTTPRRIETALGYVASAVLAVMLIDRKPVVSLTPIVIVVTACAVVGVVGYLLRCRHSRSAHEQARLQWVAWGAVVAAAISLVAFVLNALVNWPQAVSGVAAASTILLPLGLALGSSERIAVRIDRMLVHTITLAGLAGMVAACYLLIVLGLGREPTGDEQTLLGLSMVAAAVAALLWLPVRERLTDVATQRVYGERHAPEEVLRTFGSRLTRALPLDELLLQLAESLKKTMLLSRRGSVDARHRRARAGGVGAGVRARSARARVGRGVGDRARRRVGRGLGAHLASRDPVRRGRRGAADRAHHQLGRAARHDRGPPTRRRAAVQRGRRSGAHRARSPGRAGASQREARLGAAGVARRGSAPSRRAPRLPRPHRRSRRRASGARSSATSTTVPSSISSRWRST